MSLSVTRKNTNFIKSRTEIDYDFDYLVYDKQETLTIDSMISNINIDNTTKKYIDLNIKYFNDNVYNSNSENINYDFFTSISDKSLNKSEKKYFNTFDRIDDSFEYLSEDIFTKDFDITVSELNIDESGSVKDFFTKEKKVNISSEYANEISKIKSKSILLNNKIVENINSYKKIFLNSTKEKVINSKGTDFNIDNIEDNNFSFLLNNETSTLERFRSKFVGFYVKKYIKKDNDYMLKDSVFFCIKNVNDQIEKNIKDENVKYGETYLYVVYPTYVYFGNKSVTDRIVKMFLICDVPSVTEDIICKENIRPPSPINITGSYNKNNRVFYLEWEIPPNTQQDIKGFQIFKRNNLDESYKLIGQIETHQEYDFYKRNENVSEEIVIKNNVYLPTKFEDSNFDTSKINIYAICSIDAHGYVSNYSSQIAFLYMFLENKTQYDLISYEGAPLFYPNLMIPRKTILFDNDDKITTITPIANKKNKFTLMATPECFTYKSLNEEEDIDLYKNSNDSFYRFNLFRVNNRHNFFDDIKIKEYND